MSPNQDQTQPRHMGQADVWINNAAAAHCRMTNAQQIADTIQSLQHPQTKPTVLKSDSRSEVTLHEYGGRKWVIKQYRMSKLLTWLYHIVKATPAWREWRGAQRLAATGIRVNAPLALVHDKTKQTLILPYIDAPNLHDWLAGQPADRATRLRVAIAVGKQMGCILVAGLINRDHKPTNLLIDEACVRHGEQPVLIDPAGVRRRRSLRRKLEMFHVLWRASRRAGPVSLRECLTVLRAAGRVDPTLRRAFRNVSQMARTIEKIARARPLSYDPPSNASD